MAEKTPVLTGFSAVFLWRHELYIDEQLKMDLNGVPQFFSIRAEKEDTPLLVYLHGGPGDAALPLVMKYNKMLEQQFTVVIWEQRGAGKLSI